MTDDSKPDTPPKVARKQAAARKAATAQPRKPRKGGTPQAREGLHPQAEIIAVTERRANAWRMKLAGADNVTIGRALTRQGGTPHGYDGDMEDGPLASVVRSDLARAAEDRSDETINNRKKHQAMMIQRHYRALAMLWPAMSRSDARAHTAGIGHMRAIAKLGGLDEATQIAVTADNPDVQAALSKILDRVREAAEAEDVDPTGDETGLG